MRALGLPIMPYSRRGAGHTSVTRKHAGGPAPAWCDRGMTAWYDRGMTKKIGISLKDDVYEWASREVEEGRAESVSALIAEGLSVLAARSRLEALVTDLREEAGVPDKHAKARVEEALRAADEAYRRLLAASATDAA